MNKINAYARVITGNGSKSYVIDIERVGKGSGYSLRATVTDREGNVIFNKHTINSINKMKLFYKALDLCQKYIERIILEDEDNVSTKLPVEKK